jgi:hypothetical protein
MFYYIIYNIPNKSDDSVGKQNAKTFLFGSLCHIFFFGLIAILHRKYPQSFIFEILYCYYPWIFLADIITMGILYKLYFGRSIVRELLPYETDEYDEATHTFKSTKKISIDEELDKLDEDMNYKPSKVVQNFDDNLKIDPIIYLPNE